MDQRFVSHGLPSESKLAMYMSRQIVSPSLDTSPKIVPKIPQSFYPSSYSTSMINNNIDLAHKSDHSVSIMPGNMFTTPIKGGMNSMQIDSTQSIIDSPRLTPQSSPTSSNVTTSNIHQENVGGTTYFYPTLTNHTVDQLGTNSLGGGGSDASILSQQNKVAHSRSNTESPTFFDFNYQAKEQHQHVYPGPSSNLSYIQQQQQQQQQKLQRLQQTAMQVNMAEELRNEIQKRKNISNLLPNNDCQDIPQEVDHYLSLYLLEDLPLQPKQPVESSTYRATNIVSGSKFCLRRLHGFRIQSAKCMGVIDMWRNLIHSNIVQLREVFTTKAFNDNSLILVYDYHPGSQTLLSKYFTPTITDTNGYSNSFHQQTQAILSKYFPTTLTDTNGYSTNSFEQRSSLNHKNNLQRTSSSIATAAASSGIAQGSTFLPEAELWSIIMQLTAGLRVIHQAGLACRTLDPTKIIVTGKRVRISFIGISDILYFDPSQINSVAVISTYQQDDLTALGKLIIALACKSLHAVQEDNIQNSITVISRNYSKDLSNVILYLLPVTRRAVTDLMPMIGARFYTQLDALQNQCDILENELTKEMDNGRLYRILVKLGYINERPELNLDVTWSETGDRYMLKLFRDYLFHSVTEDGRAWLDHGHIVQCLNKLDAGTTEKVQLTSRNDESVLVVSYAELKHCLDQAFTELTTIV